MTGQVPGRKIVHISPQPSYLLIGSGRLAHHLKFWFGQKNISLLQWDRSQDLNLLHGQLISNPIVLLAISDKALGTFYESYLTERPLSVVHFSGSFIDSRMLSAHPLMSFTDGLYPIDFYSQIHWTLTGIDSLQELFPFLANTFSVIHPQQKALYHAACVLGGNFPVLLWTEMNRIFQQLNIPPGAAIPYLQRVLENYLQDPAQALTGPLVRGDLNTIEQNLLALKGNPYQDIYRTFTQAHKISLQETTP